jgi:hypothetical protein
MMLARSSVTAHLLRGVLGLLALAAAFHLMSHAPGYSVALGAAGLALLGGCPTCWLVGLTHKLAATSGPHATTTAPCVDGSCENER